MTSFRAALVTGAGKRIGKAIALNLASNNIAIAVHYHHSPDDADAVVAEIQNAGGVAVAVAADLSKASDVTALIGDASNALDVQIDVLVNNASVFEKDDLLSLTARSWDKHHLVNLRAPVMLMQSLAFHLGPEGCGSIINITDQRVLKPNPQYFSYSASKAGLWAATRTAAQALAPLIRVNAVGPGPTLANTGQTADAFAAEAAAVPLGQGPSVQEIANAVLFLLEAPSITGQMIALDGGQHLAWRTADILED
ncbi:MAG: short chain dehydrogenase [Kordiimonadales bacterium]|nr:MAG: short chain dehydrogenase [Kordiimonadales bacterium]